MNTLLSYTITELFHEITSHLVTDEMPSEYMTWMSIQEEYQSYPFTLLWDLKQTEQSKKYHPEGSVWNHTLLVLDEAAKVREKSKYPESFMWAALLHDIGKPTTTRVRRGKVTSYDHDKEGEVLSNEFLQFFIEDDDFIQKVAGLVRYHMHILYVLKGLPYGDIQGLIARVDIEDMALLCRCDRLGRTGVNKSEVEEEYHRFIQTLRAKKLEVSKNIGI